MKIQFHLLLVPMGAAFAIGLLLALSPASASATSCVYSTPPSVVTGAPTKIAPTTAELTGTVDPHGCATTYRFEYGATTAYGHSTPVLQLTTGDSAEAVTASISGLTPGTTYHFRILATSGTASAAGADRDLTTTCPLPTVSSGVGTVVSPTEAKLAGTVDPEGCATEYHYDYGTTTAYGHLTGGSSAGAGPVAVAAPGTVTGLTPHTLYHFRIVATNAAGSVLGRDGTFTTTVACTRPAGTAPTASTGPATSIETTTAVLTGTVKPDGCATTYYFRYGPTGAYGHTTAPGALGASVTSTGVRTEITGLAPDTVYHFRLIATSGAGSASGADVTVTTKPVCKAGVKPLPVAVTAAPSPIGQSTATLRGSVTSQGCPATFAFLYGTSTAYGHTTATGTLAGQSTAVAVSIPVAGLLPNTVYHVKLVARTAAGIADGRDLTFRTGARTPSVVHITSARATFGRGYRARVTLSCSGGTLPCRGVLRLRHGRRVIGRSRFDVPPGQSAVVVVRLNRFGRSLLSHRRRVRVIALAGPARRSIVLIRRR